MLKIRRVIRLISSALTIETERRSAGPSVSIRRCYDGVMAQPNSDDPAAERFGRIGAIAFCAALVVFFLYG
jgi:hypothetical protein